VEESNSRPVFPIPTNISFNRFQLAAFIVLSVAVILFGTVFAGAQTYTVLYTFTGGADGGGPDLEQLVKIGSDLYGTTGLGGAHGNGTVFRLSTTGQESVLHTFAGSDGRDPETGLVRASDGNLYGTTKLGGAASACKLTFETNGCGVIFRISPAGKYTRLHSFTGNDGANPMAKLTVSGGSFYGTTLAGGQNTSCDTMVNQNGCGTVFLVTAAGAVTVIHNFGGGSDGALPFGGVIVHGGALLGTTTSGGVPCNSQACGTVFELTKSGPHTVLHNFAGQSDGATPWDSLVTDSAGNLYGTTQFGGTNGIGTIFRIDRAGNKVTLHNFKGTDGAYPTAGLVRDSSGNLYGTASHGGTHKVGTVFKLDANNQLNVLHNFSGGTDGAYPYGTVLLVGNVLYGTTVGGGQHNEGTVYKIVQ
jgi:uncharacterized repeat protein (TIGR03803 family)